MYLKAKQGHPQAELIDTCWDVNTFVISIPSTSGMRINRYMLGCKFNRPARSFISTGWN